MGSPPAGRLWQVLTSQRLTELRHQILFHFITALILNIVIFCACDMIRRMLREVKGIFGRNCKHFVNQRAGQMGTFVRLSYSTSTYLCFRPALAEQR